MLKIKEKKKIIDKLKTHDTDTGSSQVQIGILTDRIKELSEHLKQNPKDNHSRRGLLKMVAKRKSFLDYLFKKNRDGYDALAKKLGLKKPR